MSTFTDLQGKIKTVGKKLNSTSVITLLSGHVALTHTLHSIHYSCGTGGSTLSILWSDGTNDFYLMEAQSISANTSDTPIKDVPLQLQSGWTIKAQAGTADKIYITLTYIVSTPNDPTQAQNNKQSQNR